MTPVEGKVLSAASRFWPFKLVWRQRYELWQERLASSEQEKTTLKTKIQELKAEITTLQTALENERDEHKKTKKELRLLEQKHSDEVRFFQDFEFRRGATTGAKWAAFCSQCHLPIVVKHGWSACCSSSNCDWVSQNFADAAIAELHRLNSDVVS